MKDTILPGDHLVANRLVGEIDRYWGTVPRGLINARPFMIYWSLERDESGSQVRWNRSL
jgi:hypothetical protein